MRIWAVMLAALALAACGAHSTPARSPQANGTEAQTEADRRTPQAMADCLGRPSGETAQALAAAFGSPPARDDRPGADSTFRHFVHPQRGNEVTFTETPVEGAPLISRACTIGQMRSSARRMLEDMDDVMGEPYSIIVEAGSRELLFLHYRRNEEISEVRLHFVTPLVLPGIDPASREDTWLTVSGARGYLVGPLNGHWGREAVIPLATLAQALERETFAEVRWTSFYNATTGEIVRATG